MPKITIYEKTAPKRKDQHGLLRPMVECDGYVMVRRPGAMPFIIPLKEFENMPIWLTD
jgi:hypothetical protein